MKAHMNDIGYSKQDAFFCKYVEDAHYIREHACCICGYPDRADDGARMSGNKILVNVFYSDFSGNAWVACDRTWGYIYPHNSSGARICNYPPRTDFQTQK